MPTTPVLKLNPALRILPFDGSGSSRWLVELDDSTGGTQRLLVSDSLAAALKGFARPQRLDDFIGELQVDGWSAAGLERLHAALADVALPRRLLVPAEAGAVPAAPQQRRPAYMTAMVQVIPPALVNPLARLLAPLFSRTGLVVGCGAALLGQAMLIDALRTPREFLPPSSMDILALLGLGALVVVLHELGHASAAWRNGARRVGIGVGWYVVMPVAYADLSETWRMNRRRRALIDVAGVFMQGLAVFALMLVYGVTGHGLVLLASVGASLSILWNLNPLLRMDGYWLMSDLLGTSNLRGEAMAALMLAWNRVAPGKWRIAGIKRTLPLATSAFLAVYAAVCVVFLAYVIVLAFRRFAGSALEILDFPRLGRAVLGEPGGTWADLVVGVGGAAWTIVVLYFLSRFFLGLARRLGGLLATARGNRSRPARPPQG